MTTICPSILAKDLGEYHQQMEKIAGFAERIQIDLTDQSFAPTQTITPDQAWWPVGIKADFHLMYRDPGGAIDTILEHRPNLVIVHAEASGNFRNIVDKLKHLNIRAGVALLPQTPAEVIMSSLNHIDHVLIFSGNLGEFGGHANLDLLKKIETLKLHKPHLEVGWDGGVNDHNISHLAAGGVDVFNVGGFIQNSSNPEHAYKILDRIAQETGTT